MADLRLASFLLLAFVTYLCGVNAVDKGNFKTCQQSGFCRRQRAYNPGVSPYKILMETVKIEDNKISGEFVDTDINVNFNFELMAVESASGFNMARLQMSPANEAIKRYEIPVGDSLVTEPKPASLTVDSKDEESYTLSFGTNKAVLQAEGFRLDFLIGSDPVMSFNADSQLKYEHYRPEKLETDEDDMWEETFKSHKDTKPYGPRDFGVDISFNNFEHVYGIPEHAASFALKSTKDTDPYRLYNLDVFEYEPDSPMALYGAVPVLRAHNEHHSVGMFLHNAAETWVDVLPSTADKGMFSKLVDMVKGDSEIPRVKTHWITESGVLDMFFLFGPTPDDVSKQINQLTGYSPLPPYFALGYQQSRWNYNDEEDVAAVDAGFDEYDIPYDVMWLDIEHTNDKRYFTWDQTKFPGPADMLDKLAAKGRNMVTIVDPHIKRANDYYVHQECQASDHYIKNKDGGDYDGHCWPGSSSWPDFLDPAVREWWASKFSLDQYQGSTENLYIWNDMNEPSVFSGPEVTMHKDAKHYGDAEHRDVHNLYGALVHRATADGLIARGKNQKRPFVLSRAYFAGSQRYGPIWTGDNSGEWVHLKESVRMLLSNNVVGIIFSGADVGGFFKNPDVELLTRWYQAAAWQPFFRGHAHLDTRRREPYLQEEPYRSVIRSAIAARYRAQPYWYTEMKFLETSGGNLCKPLWFLYPTDKETFAIEDQYIIGSSYLVKPVTDAGSTGVTVYFPGQTDVWYDADTYQKFNGGNRVYIQAPLDKIPVFQRGGTIVSKRERVRRSSQLTYTDPFTLVVALSNQGSAEGKLYIDAYDGFQDKNGEFVLRKFTFDNNQLTNSNENPGSSFDNPSMVERVVIVGLSSAPSTVELSGEGIQQSSLTFKYNTQQQILTIRKPDVRVNSNWTIKLR